MLSHGNWKPGFLIAACALGLLLSYSSGSTQGRVSSSCEKKYQVALHEFESGKYDRALNLFEALLESGQDNSLSDNCQYWIGESFFAKGEYWQAIIEFEKVFTFPKSNKKEDAQLKLGMCYIKLGDLESARRELTRLLSKYPDSSFTRYGRRLLKEL